MEPKLRFFTHDRLDLVVKYRFFRFLQNAWETNEEEEMYRRHILARTGGKEPGNPTKSTIQHYIDAARQMYGRMLTSGFDSRYPIVVDQWGRLRDGAHRLACATFLQVGIQLRVVTRKFPVRQWGIDWFLANGFSQEYVSGLLDEVNRITGYADQFGGDLGSTSRLHDRTLERV